MMNSPKTRLWIEAMPHSAGAPSLHHATVNPRHPQSGWSQPGGGAPTAILEPLSARQREVLHWICEGKRDREIAVILGISYRTVTVHVRAILNKLGVENRTSAAMLVARLSVGSGDLRR